MDLLRYLPEFRNLIPEYEAKTWISADGQEDGGGENLPDHFCDCPGHAAFGVVEMIAWVPFEDGVDAPGLYCINDGSGTGVPLGS